MSRRVLIVDDKEENLYYLEALLVGNGYQVERACHGAEALTLARQSAPDLVVSDLLMPVMDGYTLLRQWRHDSALRSIPFVVYTATYTEPEDEQLAMSLGADDFVLKPCEPEVFMQRLRAVETGVRGGERRSPGLPDESEEALLKVYSQSLIRKLEEKTRQLEEANRELQLDIARRKEAEGKLEQLAFYDPLTGLPNRQLMQDRLQHSLASSTRLGLHGALLFVDLDDFKTLNDTRGHNIGDRLLQLAAQRLLGCVGRGDTVARFGGDEYVVILEALSANPEQAATLAELTGEQMLTAMIRPYTLGDESYHGTVSIGVSLFQGSEIGFEELIRRADSAMHQAKRRGRNTLHFYDPAVQAVLETRLQLERDLHLALEERQFCLYFQPQVDRAGRVIGAEALLRWLSPEKGMISPAEFIPLAEETGLIVALGSWVMESACVQLKAWEGDSATAHLELAVNVSARQFHQAGFVEQVLEVISQTGINPARLKLELTESLILDHIESAIVTMNRLREAGVRFAMDDFGTGYSSLSYLTQLPLDQLKIDQSFIRNMADKPVNAVIVQTIIGMAGNLDMEVIAEGVETREQFEFLKAHGCRMFQGYYFGRPTPIAEFQLCSVAAGI